MNGKYTIALGAILAGLSVIVGAYEAHGLEKWLAGNYPDNPNEVAKRLANWGTGVRYQIYHSFAICLIGIVSAIVPQSKSRILFGLSTLLMVAGIVLFSGMLYLMAVSDRKLGMIVPIGGLAFILGWLLLAIGTLSAPSGIKEPRTK